MVDWNSLLKLLLTMGAFLGERKFEHHPLAPWQDVNASAWIEIVTQVADSQPVTVSAPEVDGATRFLGWAVSGRDNFFRCPYGDTRVYVRVGESTTVVRIERPGLYRVGRQ